MKEYVVTFVDKIWKRGGKRHHRTFVVKADSKNKAVKAGLEKLKKVVKWKPSGVEARQN